MRILIIYPSKDSKLWWETEDEDLYPHAFLPPLILSQLAAITPEEHSVSLINDAIEEIPFNEEFDLVAISCMTVQAPRTYEISGQFRDKGVQVVVGGIHPTQFPEEVMEHADAIVIGEAESVWGEILTHAEIKELNKKYNGGYFDLQTQVIPDWSKVNHLNKYMRIPWSKFPLMPIYTTKGCPFGCEYCVVTTIHGTKYRHRPIEHVIEEIESSGIEFYFFVDDNIIARPSYARELFTALKNMKKKILWFGQASTTILKNPDLIDLAAEAGCVSLFIGIESINPDALSSVGKKFNKVAQYEELFARIYKAGIVPYASLMFGFDEDTPETFRATLEFLRKNKIMLSSWWILCPVPGTPLYERLNAEGRVFDKYWSNYDAGHTVFKLKNFTSDELEKIYWETYHEYYKDIGEINKEIKSSGMLTKEVYVGAVCFQTHAQKQVMNNRHPFAMGGY